MRGNVDSYTTKAGKKWRIRYELPPNPTTGERRQTTKRGFRTQKEAQRALRDALGRVETGGHVDHSTITLAAYLDAWLAGIRVKPTTLANYRGSEKYVKPRIGGVKLQALTPEHLDKLYRDLERAGGRGGKPLAPKTVRHTHTMLRKALQDAVQRGHVVRNVADLANPPTQRQSRSRAARDHVWTGPQLKAFLASVAGDRWYAAWHLLATTGMRRAELLGLRWSDVDLDAAVVRVGEQTVTLAGDKPVWQTDGKTDAAGRPVALDPETVEVLRAHRLRQLEDRMAVGRAWVDDEHGPLVFTHPDGRAVHPGRFSGWFATRAKASGLPVIDVHGLRHSYATAALRAGVSPEVLSQRLGHADVAITLSSYAHVRQGDDQAAAATVAAAIFGG